MHVWQFLFLPIVFGAPTRPGVTVQKSGLTVPDEYKQFREEVVQIFKDSYEPYRRHAFGHDELRPVTSRPSDEFSAWGATVVDSMSTMIIMGLTDYFKEAVAHASSVDFTSTKSWGTVSVFETTIRYVGGLLSAYELSDKKHPVLLRKAQDIADKLAYAFVGQNVIPYGHISFSDNNPKRETTNIAEAGSLSLEWEVLSKYTKNSTYAKLGVGAARHIATQEGCPIPGMAPQRIDPVSGKFANRYVTWGGEADSYFEYLIKYARLSNTKDKVFVQTWKTAVDSSIRKLLRDSITGVGAYLGEMDEQGEVRHVSSHLSCFHAGNWLLGGRLLNNETLIELASKLNDGCWNTYNSTSTGIGPESFAFVSSDGGYSGGGHVSESQLDFSKKHGFYITDPKYILRPEVLESNFHGWRVTGDTKYLDRAAAAIKSFKKHLKLPGRQGFSDITNVNVDGAARYGDKTESFWFAETLKYLYLTFDDPKHISLDDYVFNTECHPLKAPPALASYD
ncbi:alpha-1,2-Mannosidase [Mycena indigotica]|uniref:alpha-1,2-Mannosidase n=1 Tax=Mycena indigotica TaxID=2126181 RepID=A0A8H6W4L0_9AGAR|nr:alpha-1,2-Mannosidase [Mycena indigotica]KAF7299049.1 alpha-1,2-Mannosidase [Mycena indigotica]